MKILMLVQKLPYPLYDGYNLHNYQYSKRLGGRHELHLFALSEEQPPAEIEGQFKSITTAPVRAIPRPSLLRRLAGAFSPHEMYDLDPAVLDRIKSKLVEGGFDAIWVSGWQMLVYSRRLPDYPVLGDVADEGFRDALHRFRLSRGLTARVATGRTAIKTFRYQKAYFSKCAVLNVVADEDRDAILRYLPQLEISVINNGVDSDFYRSSGEPPKPATVVFEGGMDFAPNVEGCLYFGHEVWPRILAARPDARFSIVGRDPAPEVRALASDSIEVTGFVEDVRPHLDRASVFVCPLRSGAGIKNKILQAWSMRKPVVATSISCGGLVHRDGEQLVVANEPQEIADAVLALFDDAERREQLGAAGRATVEEHYSWAAKADQMEKVLLRTASKGPRTG